MRWIAFVALGGIVLAVAGAACGDDEGGGNATATATVEGQEPANTAPPPDPTATQPPPAPTDTAVPLVTYSIASREDVSFGATVRIVYRVSVSGPLSQADLRRVAQEIIDQETSQRDVNAIGFFFFLPGTDTQSVYTAGKADWAPDGDWASADTVDAGDYSRHELGAVDVGSP